MAFLPREQHALTGGCFCKAIRYAVNIPAPAEPIDTKDASEWIVQCWPVCPADWIEWSMLVRTGPGTGSTAAASSRSSDEPSWEEAEDEDRGVCLSTLAAVGTSHPKGDPNGQAAPAEYPRSYLTYLNCSADVTRTLCSRCGTHLTCFYDRRPMSSSLPPLVGITVGRPDTESINRVRPERHGWWDDGVSWIKETLRNGDGGFLIRHPTGGLARAVHED
ncbi:hypothetical protein VTN00DRAFT_6706 [Thermoascus crustaceus]|uniref:uncharacterized protein n=1 Tax=Thermoascus crustaceus TaxID=5088 RepID=UPI0037444D79